jgi:hypothetical protein
MKNKFLTLLILLLSSATFCLAQPAAAPKIITDSKIPSPHNKITEDFMEKLASLENEEAMETYLKTIFNDVYEYFSTYECRDEQNNNHFTTFFREKGEIEIGDVSAYVIDYYSNKYKNKLKPKELLLNGKKLLGSIFENKGYQYFLYSSGGLGTIVVYKLKK